MTVLSPTIRSGLTIPELVIALAILAVLLPPVFWGAGRVRTQAYNRGVEMCASQLATQETAELAMNRVYTAPRELGMVTACTRTPGLYIVGSATGNAMSYDVIGGRTGYAVRLDDQGLTKGDVHRADAVMASSQRLTLAIPRTTEHVGPNGSGVRLRPGETLTYALPPVLHSGDIRVYVAAVTDANTPGRVDIAQGRLIGGADVDQLWPARRADGTPRWDVRFARYAAANTLLRPGQPITVTNTGQADVVIGGMYLR